jgi:hypothetical protein
MANVGDINGDGADDLIVGAPGELSNYSATDVNGTEYWFTRKTGAVYILFMEGTTGEVQSSTRVSGLVGGMGELFDNEDFGYSVASIGDLDGDGIPDVAVGAPGTLVSAVYILYLNWDGTARDYVMIRGYYTGTAPALVVNGSYVYNTTYTPTGPDHVYNCRMGSTVAPIGDWDEDGIPDMAVTSLRASGGGSYIYFMYMHRNGSVKSYSNISSADGDTTGGAPDLDGRSYVSFGSSILLFPDHDGDGIPELVIGAKDLDDADTSHYKSGVVYFCFMHRNGTIREYSRISELSEADNKGGTLPYTTDDACGTSLAQIGDLNKDDFKQQHPTLRSEHAFDENFPDRKPLTDLIVGCPQTNTGDKSGRIFLMFLTHKGRHQAHTKLPGETDTPRGIGPGVQFGLADNVGHSLAAMGDYDMNGIQEIAVGAPGTADQGEDSGAVYIWFLRRRRWHSFVPDTRAYLCAIIIPPSLFVFFCYVSIIYFFVRFRRKPDKIELMMKEAGVEVGKKAKVKKRTRKERKEESKVAVDLADDF